ncbi:hypothetical protein M441DRAFT_320662 [Trichoderma asperellum CBS 433.97]|uniref:Uncharacterized protein n=1 Tax=Trichoderma asperellum (strain ATCC 204424 / CBS 433.97 / NBRC 101777) TaxID=1042311 RepID=A0A2T3ZL97_TRIA4|nr:hypothetical protein M441DRAFT_320662 [Trichoderma asperellum CBS 433.97]PTB45563.1 hypothetical protein M441DRAFT_320662 [Trichoderma asperellum CBS 433.97]
MSHASYDAVPTRGTWICPISAKEPHPHASDSRWTGSFRKMRLRHTHMRARTSCPLFLNKPFFDSSDQSEAVLAQRGQDASSPRLLVNKGPGRIAAHLHDAKQPSSESAHTPDLSNRRCPRAHKPKALLGDPASARWRTRLGAPSLVLGRFIHAMRTGQAALFAPRMENLSGENPTFAWPTATSRGWCVSSSHIVHACINLPRRVPAH